MRTAEEVLAKARERIERDEIGRFTAQAGAGVATAGLASTVGGAVAAERLLRSRAPVEIFRPGDRVPPASWASHRRLARRARQAGTYGRRGVVTGLTAVGLGTGLPALEEHVARRKRRTALLDPPRLQGR